MIFYNKGMQEHYNLFLDDVRKPQDVKWIELPIVNWVVVRDANQFCRYIEEHGLPQMISLDHDLAAEHYVQDWANNPEHNIPNGMYCVKWLIHYCDERGLDFPTYFLHTLNVVGKENMDSQIRNHLKSKINKKHETS